MSRWRALAVAATIPAAEYEPRLVDALEAFAALAAVLDDYIPRNEGLEGALVPHPDALVEAAQALIDTLEERTAEKQSFEEESQGFENERDEARETLEDALQRLEEAQKQIDSLEKQRDRAEKQAATLREELTQTQIDLRHARDGASEAAGAHDDELRALRAFRETIRAAFAGAEAPKAKGRRK